MARLTPSPETNPHLNPHESHVRQLQCRACHHMHKESEIIGIPIF
ncbi:cytochrome c3 family protein [Desulfosarcina ovata]